MAITEALQAQPDSATSRIMGTVRLLMRIHDEQQTAIARLLGVTPATVSRMFNGHQGISVESVEKLAHHYGVGVEDLFAGPDPILERVQKLK